MEHSVITLRSGEFVAQVAPSAGGSITRYAWDSGDRSLELLRPASAEDLANAVPTGMACFPLIPFSNRIRDGRFTFGGREVQLSPNFPPEPHTIHGHGWQTEWEVEEQATDRLTIGYSHEADEWPWPYRARLDFNLSADSLQVTLGLTNEGGDPMPAGFGLHPYFVRTPATRLTAAVTGVWLSDEDSMPTDLVALPADRRLDEGINPRDVSLDHNFAGWNRAALVEWPDRGARLTLTGDELFKFLVVYTPVGEEFACVEPVSNVLDAFNLAQQGRSDTGMFAVEPGATVNGTITFAPEISE